MRTETGRWKGAPRMGGLVAVCLLLALAAGAASFAIAKATWSTARTTSGEVDARAPDMDGDGIWDVVDLEPLVVSGAFSDGSLGGTTFGEILDRAGLTVEVREEPNPEGVRIAASGSGGPATVNVCALVTLEVSLGDEVVVTCGSATVEVLVGPVDASFGSFGAYLPTGTAATIVELVPGIFEVTNSAESAGSITVNGMEIPPGVTETDDDGDGCFTSMEEHAGTDPLDACPDVVSSLCGSPPQQYPCCPGPECDGDDAWPYDLNVDRTADILDVLLYKAALGGAYDARYDLDVSDTIDILDVLLYKAVLMTSCSNP